ncbi:histidinol-phosphatase [Tothia fuscella]|uniref:Histidinol-phosphatase n=1 Tax=Tothia fuscella TaxID=1048955 RepID=A0A9P4NJF4_9PEZI|nr:histidinol-phosphatase [Tothia fuscella]
MPFSHHSHSGQFCGHAKGQLEDMVQTAIERKMYVFALTEHMPRDIEDFYPEEIENHPNGESLWALTDQFYAEATRLKHKYESKINLPIGFESEWIRSSTIGLIERLQQKYAFDFFVGSVHHVHTIPIDFDRKMYEEARSKSGSTDEQLFKDYFDAQYDMLQALQPPVVGHFDLIRLFSEDPERNLQQWAGVWSKIKRNLQYMAEYGGILELNSSALRKGMTEPYPTIEISKEFLKLKGRFTLSDDSHSLDQIGFNYSRVLAAIQRIGITQLYYYGTCQKRAGAVNSTDGFVATSLASLEESEFWRK